MPSDARARGGDPGKLSKLSKLSAAEAKKNNELIDLIENPYIRERIRSRGIVLGKDEEMIRVHIRSFNIGMRMRREGATLTEDNVNIALTQLFNVLDEPTNPGFDYRGSRLRAFPDDQIIGEGNFAALEDEQVRVNILCQCFSHESVNKPLPVNRLAVTDAFSVTTLPNQQLLKLFVDQGFDAAKDRADPAWDKVRGIDWAKESYEGVVQKLRDVIKNPPKENHDILSPEQFKKFQIQAAAYSKFDKQFTEDVDLVDRAGWGDNLTGIIRHRMGRAAAAPMEKSWRELTEPSKRGDKPVERLLSVVEGQIQKWQGGKSVKQGKPVTLDLAKEDKIITQLLTALDQKIALVEKVLLEQDVKKQIIDTYKGYFLVNDGKGGVLREANGRPSFWDERTGAGKLQNIEGSGRGASIHKMVMAEPELDKSIQATKKTLETLQQQKTKLLAQKKSLAETQLPQTKKMAQGQKEEHKVTVVRRR